MLIYWVTYPDTNEYLSINTTFLKKHRNLLVISFFAICALAFIAPIYLYNNDLPDESIILGSIGPVSNIERLTFVFLSLTAGICEEVIFRGYGISVLERMFKNRTIALVISSLAFMSLHGLAFLPWYLLVQYFIIGLIFGYFFQKYRRLEILIIIHFLIDTLVAVAVP